MCSIIIYIYIYIYKYLLALFNVTMKQMFVLKSCRQRNEGAQSTAHQLSNVCYKLTMFELSLSYKHSVVSSWL